jgi:hypothetical protein
LSPTHAQVLAEIDEMSKDLEVFARARDDIRRRVQEVVDQPRLLTPLPTWSGTDAVLGSLDLVVHAIERTIEELRSALDQVPKEPLLRIVRNSDEPQS